MNSTPSGDEDGEEETHELDEAEKASKLRMQTMLQSFSQKSDAKLDFDFNRLGLRLNTNGLQVLRGVTGHLPAGAVTAVMGPSGAGKTTFLNTLSGKATYGTVTGEVLINGRAQVRRWGGVRCMLPKYIYIYFFF